MVWRPSLVLLHQFTGPGGLQAWCLSVQVLTTSLEHGLCTPFMPNGPGSPEEGSQGCPVLWDVRGLSLAQMGPGGPGVAGGGRALGRTQPGASAATHRGLCSSSAPAFLLLPSAVRAFCAAQQSGRAGAPPQTPPDSPAHLPTSCPVCTDPARPGAGTALPRCGPEAPRPPRCLWS